MSPAIVDGEVITVEPIALSEIECGDIILYEAGNRVIAHRVIRTFKGESPKRPALSFILRGDAFKTCDEPVSGQRVLGKVVSVRRRGEEIRLSANFTSVASH